MCIGFIGLIALHEDCASNRFSKFLVKIVICIAMYCSWLVFSWAFLNIHECYYEYRGIENGKEKYVEYNMFKTDSTYIYADMPDTITGTVIKSELHDNHLHVNIECEDGYKINDVILDNITVKEARNKKYKVRVNYYPIQKYTLLK